MKRRIINLAILFGLVITPVLAKSYEPVPSNVKLPIKYTQDYINSISDEYKDVSNEQIFHVASTCLKIRQENFHVKRCWATTLLKCL